MDVIVVSHKRGKTWKLRLDFAHLQLWVPVAMVLLGIVCLSFAAGHYTQSGRGFKPESLLQSWNAEIKAQRAGPGQDPS